MVNVGSYGRITKIKRSVKQFKKKIKSKPKKKK